MVNITIAEGGGVVADGVITYLPHCSTFSYNDVSMEHAQAFDITDSTYFVNLIPSTVPGLLFGFMSLLGVAFFSIWLCMQCGRHPHGKPRALPEQAQFLTSQHMQSSPDNSHPPKARSRKQREQEGRRGRAAFAYKALLVAFALALTAISSWGMAESIKATNNTFSDFWDLVAAIDVKVANATVQLRALGEEVTELSGNVSVVTSKAPEILNLFDTVVGWLNTTELSSALAASSKLLNSSLVTSSLDPATLAFLNTTADSILTDTATGNGWVGGWLEDPGSAAAVRQLVATATEALLGLPDELAGIQASIDSGATMLSERFNETLADIQQSYKAPTLAIENTWRFIPIAVVFGTTILVSLLICATFWSLRWYRTSTATLVLLWLDIALLMFLGVGLLRSLNIATSDSCLYGEFLSLALANRKVAAAQRQRVINIFSYYYGLVAIPDYLVVTELLGVPTYKLHQLVYGPIIPVASRVLQMSNTPQMQALLVQAGLNGDGCADCVSALGNITTLLPAVSSTVWALEEQALASSITPLYHQAKRYLCCTLAKASNYIWIAWTCAGTIGFVLAVMCTARIMHHTLNLRRYERQVATAAAAAAAAAYQPATMQSPPTRGKEGLGLGDDYRDGHIDKAVAVQLGSEEDEAQRDAAAAAGRQSKRWQ